MSTLLVKGFIQYQLLTVEVTVVVIVFSPEERR